MRLHQNIPFVYPASVGTLLSSNTFRLVDMCFGSPVPQAFRLSWHTEAVPVVGEVAVNTQQKQRRDEHTSPLLPQNTKSKL